MFLNRGTCCCCTPLRSEIWTSFIFNINVQTILLFLDMKYPLPKYKIRLYINIEYGVQTVILCWDRNYHSDPKYKERFSLIIGYKYSLHFGTGNVTTSRNIRTVCTSIWMQTVIIFRYRNYHSDPKYKDRLSPNIMTFCILILNTKVLYIPGQSGTLRPFWGTT